MEQPISPLEAAQRLTEFWSPRVIGELDDSYLKVARLHGEFMWHSHEQEDELFYVLKGQLKIRMEAGEVSIGQGECFIVPKGVSHLPIADEECLVLLLERKTTQHTGGALTERTKSVEDQLRPL